MSSLTNSGAGRSGRGHLARALFLSTALAGLGGRAVHAQTQTGPGGAATVTPDRVPRAQDTPVANTGAVGLSEVVVTARRRAENLQTTPVSETAISGALAEELNVRTFQDLRGLVPNLEVTPQANGGAALTIRGVGQTNDQVNADVKTGFYVDEMYVGRQEGNQFYFYDVDSLQVLKGPQGTLFGKNTTGGAILLSTARPTPEFGGYIQVRAGNYGRLDTEGAINMPISDTLMTRFSFKTESADGFIKHVLDSGYSNNINNKSGRAQIRWKPTSKLIVDLLAEYNQSDTDGTTSIITGCDDTQYYTVNYAATYGHSYCAQYPILNKGYEVYGGATLTIPTSALITPIARGGDYNTGNISRYGHPNPFNHTEVTTANLRLTYALTDDISLKSITTYRRSHAAFYSPTQNAPNDIYGEYDSTATGQFTEEDNITGRGFDGRLNYVAGFYYYSQSTAFLQDTGPDWADPVGYVYAGNNDYKSYAGYIQASYKIIPPVELTVGARYTVDHKAAASSLYFQENYSGVCTNPNRDMNADPYDFVAPFVAGAAACASFINGAGAKSWSSLNPRVQLSYQFTPDIYLYGSITTGYNSGGFNQQLGASLPGNGLIPYNPEKLIDYEGGIKTEWLDRRLRINVTGFYQKYSDIQANILVTYNHVATRAIATGATEHEEGVEAEVEFEPTRDLFLRGNMSYLEQAYDTIAPSITQFTLNSPVGTAPKYTYSFDAAYTIRFDQGYILTPDINWRGVGPVASCDPLVYCYLPAYGLLGARVDFKLSQESPWTATLWGSNLNDARINLGQFLVTGGSFGVAGYTPGRPREYGVEFTRKF